MRTQRIVGRINGMKHSWKGHKDRNRHKYRINRSGQARLVHVKDMNRSIPTTWRWARGDCFSEKDGFRDITCKNNNSKIYQFNSVLWPVGSSGGQGGRKPSFSLFCGRPSWAVLAWAGKECTVPAYAETALLCQKKNPHNRCLWLQVWHFFFQSRISSLNSPFSQTLGSCDVNVGPSELLLVGLTYSFFLLLPYVRKKACKSRENAATRKKVQVVFIVYLVDSLTGGGQTDLCYLVHLVCCCVSVTPDSNLGRKKKTWDRTVRRVCKCWPSCQPFSG